MKSENYKIDHRIISGAVETGSRVLDLGCGEGDLLALLKKEKRTSGQGIELRSELIYKCVEKGVNVFHGDVDSGLDDYKDKSFDYVILNQSLPEVKNIQLVIKEALRVGKKVVIGFPNFAYISARSMLFFAGRVPVTPNLPYYWFNTPNLHFWTIRDFKEFCKMKQINITAKYFIRGNRRVRILPNLFAEKAIFVLSEKPQK